MVRWFLPALVVAMLAPPALGGAQAEAEETEAVSVPDPEQLRHWDAEGRRLYNERRFQEAYEAFLRVARQHPTPATQFNVGRCLARMGRFSEAIAIFETVLADATFPEAAQDRARLELNMAEEGQAHLQFNGARGEVFVGARSCESPCTMRLDPGRYEYVFGRERRELELARGERRTVVLTAPVDEVVPRGPYRPSWGTAVGLGLVALGGAGTLGFGLHTQAIRDEFVTDPVQSVSDRGNRARLLTNLSIGVAALGLAIFLTEVLVGSLRRRPREEAPVTEARLDIPAAW